MTHLGFPSTARPTGRDRPPVAMWDRLAAELDRWDAAGRRATFWWRDDDAAAGALGYLGLSTSGQRHRVNTHIDIIDWAGDPGIAGDDARLEAAVAHLSDRLDGRCDADEPTGLLTHHLVQDEAFWRFIDRFVGAIRRHPAAAWIDLTETLGAVNG